MTTDTAPATHSPVIGYIFWIFGFFGAHRFFYGRRVSGIIYLFTLGLFLVGWIIDLFLIPSLNREANRRYLPGPFDYNAAWLLLAFTGILGLHRFYMGKWGTGLLYLFTLGLLGLGCIYDMLTLNEQILVLNTRESRQRQV